MAKVERSPSFPFISLGKAVDRAHQLESEYRRHPARANNAVRLWGYKDKSSGGQQTIAAMIAYGLVEVEGKGSERKITLTDRARVILKEAKQQPRMLAIRQAALQPFLFQQAFNGWGVRRPPDAECLSQLELDLDFPATAAKRFLGVYDDTIRYANLTDSDIISDESEEEIGVDFAPELDSAEIQQRIKPMQGERVVISQEINGPEQNFRLLVIGPVDDKLLDALDGYVKFQKGLIGGRDTSTKQANEDGQ